MAKILESEFRKELYKNLVDAGYEKQEAQKIIGTKYYVALKDDVKNSIGQLLESVETEKYDFDSAIITVKIMELVKLSEMLK